MHRKEAQEPSRFPTLLIFEPNKCHILVLIELVPAPLLLGVRQVGRGRPVPISIYDGRIPDRQGAGGKRGVCALRGEDCTLDDRCGRSIDVSQSGELREEVLEIASHAGVLVRADERDVLIRVDTGELRAQLGDDGTPDSRVAHCDV